MIWWILKFKMIPARNSCYLIWKVWWKMSVRTVWWWGIELFTTDDAGSIPGRRNPLSHVEHVDMFQHTFNIKQHDLLAGIIKNDEFLPVIYRMKTVLTVWKLTSLGNLTYKIGLRMVKTWVLRRKFHRRINLAILQTSIKWKIEVKKLVTSPTSASDFCFTSHMKLWEH
jgi:hypothetical protein